LSNPAPETSRPTDPLGLITGGEAVITGTVVCGTVIATAAGQITSISALSAAIIGSVVLYFLAHVHAEVLGSSIAHGHHPAAAIRHAFAHSAPMVIASLVPVAVLVAADALGAQLRMAALLALAATAGLLAFYSFLAAHRRRASRLEQVVSGSVGLALGLLIIALKTVL
jgi:hypothetical protein